MNAPETGRIHRTLRQPANSKGEPYPCYATENLWVGYEHNFSSPTSQNTVEAFTTGKDYFAALIAAAESATSEIYIAGWQVNWDAMLAPGVRLFDILLKAAQNGCKIYVMPWDDNAPVQTYDDQTKSVLLAINGMVGQTRVHVGLAGAKADKANAFFSHHQKQVVIDRKIAFVGGIDLAYGRYDDARYSLIANAEGRTALNRYNGCVAQTGKIDPRTVVDPDLLTGAWDRWKHSDEVFKQIREGAHQAPYTEDAAISPVAPGAMYETLDPQTQPRMPWQDAQLKLTGAVVVELTRNFVLRWNSIASKQERLNLPRAPGFDGIGGHHVQVLRSAPSDMRKAELSALSADAQKVERLSEGVQDDIFRAMAILIDKAQHFIYIENQFFVSDFGGQDAPEGLSGPAQTVFENEKSGVRATRVMPGASTQLPQNEICNLLAGRIGRAILDATKPHFHVYITLPVHPEGSLGNGAIMSQVHWTMQSLVFGSMSLLNRIRRFIKARELYDKKDADWGRVFHPDNREYKDVDIEKCFTYVTLLNLRNWEKIGERYVTEQIYVHSKMMIVDDRFALVGSANINDRSLLGSRDSELAVLVMDTDTEKTDVCGDGKMRPTRGFARELRKKVWKKIFGITGGGRAATELASVIDKPADPKTWEKIQMVAEANTKLYEAAFDWIPRNKDPFDKSEEEKDKAPASIWSRWHFEKQTKQGQKKGPMSFDKEFWTAPQHKPAAVNLTQVKGYITLLPIEWTAGENNNVGHHTMLLTENDKKALPGNAPTQLGQAPTDARKA